MAVCFICNNSPYKTPGLSLHRFPSRREVRLQWLKMCNMTEKDYRPSRKICSNHFDKSCYYVGHIRKTLKYGSIPTIFFKKEPGCLMVKKEPGEENIKTVVIKQELNKIETPFEKPIEKKIIKNNNQKKSFNVEKKKEPEEENIKTVVIKQELNKFKTLFEKPTEKKRKNHEKKSFYVEKKKEPEEENIKPVVIKQELNKIETPFEKPIENPIKKIKIKKNHEKKFCPSTMVRYDNVVTAYKTIWVCQNCLSALLSENAVHNHLKISCLHRDMRNSRPNNDIEDTVNDEGNTEDNGSGDVNLKGQ